MARGGLRGFVEELGAERLEGEVEPEFEATRILAEAESRGVPVYFRVKGRIPEAVGPVVSRRAHILKALRASSDAEAYKKLLESMASPLEPRLSGTPGGLRRVEGGLRAIPSVKFYERDGGEYLTSTIIVACLDGLCNASIHRVMVRGPNSATVRVVPRHLWRMYREKASKGEPLKVSLVVGVHPAVMLAAASSPRYGVFELGVAARLLGGLEAVESPLHGNPVPWPFSAVIEGLLLPEMDYEGPFVDATRTYDIRRKQPVLKVLGVYVNVEEPFHVIRPGGVEHALLMGFPREAQIWESVSRVVPRVVAVRLTPASGGWLHAIVSIEKSHDGDGKNAILAAFAAHPSLKHVVVVDPDIDVDDPQDVEWAIATRFRADRDLVVIRGARGSTLDPSSADGLTAKMGLDATAPLGERGMYEKARIPGG